MQKDQLKLMDNSTPIPELVAENVAQWINENIIKGAAITYTTKLRMAAQYGYNIAQVFVEELKKQNTRLQKAFSDTQSAKEVDFDEVAGIRNIDTRTKEGKLLMASMAILTTTSRTDKTPNEVLEEIKYLAMKMYDESYITDRIPHITSFIFLAKKHFAFTSETFPMATPLGSLNKAMAEITETAIELRRSEENIEHITMEYADVFLCLIDSFSRMSITAAEVLEAMNTKININKARKWKLNEDGQTYSHIKAST